MSSRSVSEGEISETKIEKATTTPSTKPNSSVNRKLREALSPSPEFSRTSASPAASNEHSRYRSRSPYREDRPVKGEKRRRDDEFPRDNARSDSRRFKVHYEDRSGRKLDDVNRDRRDPGHKDFRSGDKQGRGGYNDRIRHDDREERDRNKDKRQRTTSRSPFRHEKADGRSDGNAGLGVVGPSTGHSGRGRDKDDKYDRKGALKAHFIPQQLPNGRAATTVAPAMKLTSTKSSTHLERSTHLGKPNSKGKGETTTNGSGSIPYLTPSRRPDEDVPLIKTVRFDNDALAKSADAPSKKVQIVELSAEERRKRREAIKAKYSTATADPRPFKHLQEVDTPTTPASPADTTTSTPSQHASPAPDTPHSPRLQLLGSAAASPPHIHVSHDDELANRLTANATTNGTDERSAFDYDPTMDMEEDRYRGDKFHNTEEISATSYNETLADEDKKILLPESVLETTELVPQNKKKTSDDMFASDDEDDMFAPVATEKITSSAADASRAVAVPKAKTLDQSLLDDWDDKDGYYRVILGELLDERYHVLASLGKGVFSGVVRATDTDTQRLVAIKIIRNQDAMVKAGMKEMEILQKLANADPDDKKHVIRLERSFNHKGHLCMVFENLSLDLRGVLQKFGRDVGINLKAVRSYAQQMFVALGLLQKCNILHADLKPDNILVNEARNLLKICDLGSAADAADGSEITPYLVSRFYRAPEIMLGMKYDFALDMWSIGCTLYELYTGKILFTGRNNNQMLRCIMECRGKFSLKMLKKGQFSGDHFDDQNLNFISREIDRITGREVVKLVNIVKPVKDLKSRLLTAAGATSGNSSLPDTELKELNLFADLLDRCLTLNPEKRIKPQEALKHPFVYRPALAFGSGK